MEKRWYTLHTLTDYEQKVREKIEKMIEGGLKDKVFNLLIPTEEVVEVHGSRKKVYSRKFFPGYIFVEMVLDETSWAVLRTVQGVIGFLGGMVPAPLPEDEVKNIFDLVAASKEAKPKPAVVFEKDENVRITEGPFTNFVGVVEEVNLEKAKLKVMVTIFGRATPVELDFLQVEKM